MSTNDVTAFWRKVDKDPDLSHELEEILQRSSDGARAEEIVALGATHGFDFDGEELRGFFTAQEGELSEEELATAAGGTYAVIPKLEAEAFKVEIEGVTQLAIKYDLQGTTSGVILFP